MAYFLIKIKLKRSVSDTAMEYHKYFAASTTIFSRATAHTIEPSMFLLLKLAFKTATKAMHRAWPSFLCLVNWRKVLLVKRRSEIFLTSSSVKSSEDLMMRSFWRASIEVKLYQVAKNERQ